MLVMGATLWPEPCDLCGGPFMHLHCKLTCNRCGYRRDCSDP